MAPTRHRLWSNDKLSATFFCTGIFKSNCFSSFNPARLTVVKPDSNTVLPNLKSNMSSTSLKTREYSIFIKYSSHQYYLIVTEQVYVNLSVLRSWLYTKSVQSPRHVPCNFLLLMISSHKTNAVIIFHNASSNIFCEYCHFSNSSSSYQRTVLRC